MRTRLALLLALVLAGPSLPAGAADTLRDRLQHLAERFQAEQSNLQALQKRTDAEAALTLGRLLKNGLLTAGDNPLRRADRGAAEVALQRAIAGGGPASVAAAAELADLLIAADRPEADRRRAIELYRTAAAGGNSIAAVALGRLLEDGAAIPRDLAAAKALYTQGLAAEEPDAAFGLGRIAAIAGDSEAAKSFAAQGIVLLHLRAEHSAAAAGALATRYVAGDGLPRDPGHAREMLRKAIALGGTAAAVAAAKDLAAGPGPDRDPDAARSLLLDAEAAGSIEAARTLLADAAGAGVLHLAADELELIAHHVEGTGDIEGMLVAAGLYRSGHGVKADAARSTALFDEILTAARHDPRELVRLGRIFKNGTVLPADPGRAMTLFMAAVAAGLPEGAVAAAELALDGTVKLSPVEAERLVALLKAPDLAKDPRALLLLGDAYRRGFGGAKSAADAGRYYDAALAISSDPLVMERRALLYLENVTNHTDGLRAMTLLQRAANRGQARAMDVLGRQYEHGSYLPQDLAAAEGWFTRASELGLASGLIDLGELYEAAPPPIGSRDKAVAAYQRAWAAGIGDAGLHLGRLLRADGKLSEAKAMLQAAMARGDGVAAIELAALALAGEGAGKAEAARLVDQGVGLARADAGDTLNVAEAIAGLPDTDLRARGIKLLSDLDAGGDGAATHILATLYVAGQIGGFDLPKAEAWARKAAERGSVQPLYQLATALIRGRQGNIDAVRGVALLEEAHRLAPTDIPTVIRLARQYQIGAHGVRHDVGRAVALLEEAAEFGSTTAQVLAARAYADGSGVARDPDKAIRWLGRAADQGSVEAMLELGRYYTAGEGVTIDAERAFGLFYRAAGQGSLAGQVEAGKAMLIGYGTEQNVAEGLRMLKGAAVAGSATAMFELFHFYRLAGPGNADEALHWIRAAAQHGSGEAAFRLALLYRDGDMVGQSDSKTRAWLNRAARSGHFQSATLLAKLQREARANGAPADVDDDTDE